ncbi:MAG: HAD-IA family hydrolase [Bacteroidia bacterium]
MKKQLIIFDFDGTIADTLVVAEQIMHDLSPEFGLPRVTRKEIMALKHKSIPELLKISGLSWAQVPIFVHRARGKFKAYLTHVNPILGMPEALLSLRKRGYRMGILTSNSKASVRQFLTMNQLQFFEFIHAPRSLFGKSSMMQKIIKSYKLSPEEVSMIGDEVRDVEAARKAGIDSIAVTWGFNSEDLLKTHAPKHLINQPGELLEIFE